MRALSELPSGRLATPEVTHLARETCPLPPLLKWKWKRKWDVPTHHTHTHTNFLPALPAASAAAAAAARRARYFTLVAGGSEEGVEGCCGCFRRTPILPGQAYSPEFTYST